MPRRVTLPDAAEALKQGRWSAAEVASLLDVPLPLVRRWCEVGVVPAVHESGTWWLEGRALFVFCSRSVEPHYSPETVAGLLDRSLETVRGWIKRKRLKTVKLGAARNATVLVPESELRRWLQL